MCLHNSIHLTDNLCKRQIQIKHLNTYPTTMHLIYIVRLDFFFRLRVKKHPWNCILFFSKLIAAVFYIGKNLIQDVLIIYNLPSLFELNSICFSANYINNDITSQIDKMSVSFESYTSIYKLGGCNDIKNLPKNVLLFLDGLSNANKFEDGVYLYRYLKSEPK